MKTNVLIGITAIMLLLTLPATASDYTLGIFGNANEDDTINMQDVTYTELIILEYRDKTELSDAKYDGKINMQDVTQIELTILGKEKELTVLDSVDRIVTLEMPIERVIALSTSAPAGTYRILGAMDKIVGINQMITGDPFYPELQDKPAVGWPSPDYEAIVELDPDLIVAGTGEFYYFEILEKMEPLGIDVVLIDCGGKPPKYFAELRTLGMILGATERVEEYIDFSQSYLDLVEERIQELSPEEKKTVYFEFIDDYAIMSRSDDVIHRAGGVHVFADLFLDDPMEHKRFTVEPEAVVARNPDVIIKDPHLGFKWSGYAHGVTGSMDELREELMERPGWSELNAVSGGEVYIQSRELGNDRTLGTCFLAKLLYPDLFSDLDTGALLEEYLEKYHGMDYDDYQVAVYHPDRLLR